MSLKRLKKDFCDEVDTIIVKINMKNIFSGKPPYPFSFSFSILFHEYAFFKNIILCHNCNN